MMSQSQYYHHVYRHMFRELNEVITLSPFGDIHRDTDNCALDQWHDYLKHEEKSIKEGANRLYIGTGDYLDLMSDSERWNIDCAKKHESTKKSFDELAKDRCNLLAQELSFMEGSLIGLIEGNHYYVFQNGATSTQYLCDKLGCAYLGGVATIKLFLYKLSKRDKECYSADILVSHHGSAGTLLGGALNSLERMMKIASMDIYIQGHSHQRICTKVPKPMFLDKYGKLRARSMVLCNPGSYLLGYVHGRESYAVKKLSRPVGIGPVYIDMMPRRVQRGKENDRFLEFRTVD